MGRYFSGDIEGKFWFAVQDSNDADFFGVWGCQPNELNYYFDKENLKDINKGIKKCKKELGEYKRKLNNFFEDYDYYSDEDLAKKMGVNETKIKELLVWYARLELGLKIQKCVKKEGKCEFTAEI